MTEFEPKLFESDAAVRRIGEGLLAHTLVRADWTHEAHLAACLWLIVERPDIDAERELPDIIRRFNESVGGVNDETQGYHETITQSYIITIRRYLSRVLRRRPEPSGTDGAAGPRPSPGHVTDLVNGLLRAEEGHRDWPLRFYSKERLFSVEARLGFLEPDLQPLP